jgi:hypothetical protein
VVSNASTTTPITGAIDQGVHNYVVHMHTIGTATSDKGGVDRLHPEGPVVRPATPLATPRHD